MYQHATGLTNQSLPDSFSQCRLAIQIPELMFIESCMDMDADVAADVLGCDLHDLLGIVPIDNVCLGCDQEAHVYGLERVHIFTPSKYSVTCFRLIECIDDNFATSDLL